MNHSINDIQRLAQRPLVVMITGPSSSGKSSLTKALAKEIEGAHMVSLDQMLREWDPARPCRTMKEAEYLGFTAEVYHDHLLQLAQQHPVIVCDHVLCGNTAWESHLQARLASVDLFLLELTCEKDVLKAREESRTDRPPMVDHALYQAERQRHRPNDTVDMCLNSTECSTEELAAEFLKLMPLYYMEMTRRRARSVEE